MLQKTETLEEMLAQCGWAEILNRLARLAAMDRESFLASQLQNLAKAMAADTVPPPQVAEKAQAADGIRSQI